MNSAHTNIAQRLLLGAALTPVLTGSVLAFSMQASASDPALGTRAPAVAAQPTTTLVPASRPRAQTGPYRYAWPLKPFHAQHPVRGFFGDPRISNHQRTKQFHFGVDISAPNDTPVYATLTGRISIHPRHPHTVGIVGRDGQEHSYWHVIPTVRTGERAIAFRTVVGRIEAPYGHVHFSEARHGRYLNPLRPGAMGPFADGTRPSVTSVAVEHGDRQLLSAGVREPFHLVAEVQDETPIAIPRPWHDLPVTPALVRWRLVTASGRVVIAWKTAADFRETIPPASEYDRVWAPGTTQNHVRLPGRYRVFLARGLELPSGRYLVEVAVRDTRGNRSSTGFPLVALGA